LVIYFIGEIMTNSEFYRHMISKRVAVKALVDINKTLYEERSPYFYGYESGRAGEFDRSVCNMALTIRRLMEEVKEYRALKKALTPILEKL